MRMQAVIVLGLLIPVSACVRERCCCDPCPVVVEAPAAPVAVEAIARSPVPTPASAAPKPPLPLELARLRASLLRKEVESLPPAARGARVREALSGEPSLVQGLEPEVWAGISPDVISVYDATSLAAFAPDLPVAVRDLVAGDEAETASGPTIDPRIRRFVSELRAAANQALVVLHPTGAIVVVARPEDQIDHAIWALSRAGSTLARLEVDLIPDGAGLPLDIEDQPSIGAVPDRSKASIEALGRPWKRSAVVPDSRLGGGELAFYARLGAPAFPASPERLHLDVPCGSRCGSKRTTSVAYVQDFDVEISSVARLADPIIGTIETGLVVEATLRPCVGDDPGSLVVELSWSELVEPIPTFTTRMENLADAESVTIDLPELRLQRATITMPAVAGAAAYLPFKINGVVVRVAAIEPMSVPDAPLVHRIAAGSTRSAENSGDAPATFQVDLARTPSTADPYSGVAEAKVSLSVTAGRGDAASVSIATPVSYIRDFDVETGNGGLIIYPIVAVVEPGFEVRLRARAGAGTDVVACGSLQLTQLVQPMRTYAVPGGTRKGTTIQLPRTRQVVEAFAGTWAPGATHRWSLTGPGGAQDATTIDVRRGEATGPAPATK